GPECGGTVDKDFDRLAKANVVRSLTIALTQSARGFADYDTVESGAEYGEDNLVSSTTDGEHRSIDLPIARAAGNDLTRFAGEGVSARLDYDPFGRVKQTQGSGAGAPTVQFGYDADGRGRSGAGLLKRIEHGAGAFWQQISYDKAFNVDEVTTSQGTT